MANCSNCGAQHGCSCQIKTATDGKKCCSSCIQTYENQLKLKKLNEFTGKN